jgi:hypothetical protein
MAHYRAKPFLWVKPKKNASIWNAGASFLNKVETMQPMYVPENAVPPEDVRFEEITVEPWPDTRRIRVRVGITPFTSPPNIRVEVIDPKGQAVTTAHIVETINHRMVFTLHLRTDPLEGNYTLSAEVYYLTNRPGRPANHSVPTFIGIDTEWRIVSCQKRRLMYILLWFRLHPISPGRAQPARLYLLLLNLDDPTITPSATRMPSDTPVPPTQTVTPIPTATETPAPRMQVCSPLEGFTLEELPEHTFEPFQSTAPRL